MIGDVAMVLAAGFGTRMQPLTATQPKPLINVAGQPIIAYAFEHLRIAGVKRAVVNAHYLADQIDNWCATITTPATQVSDERDAILDTGGGIARALPLLGPEPFFVMNSDSFWVDHATPALQRLRDAWDHSRMECLLLLAPVENTTGYDGHGDFAVLPDSQLRRRKAMPDETAYAYIGGYLVSPKLFADAPQGAFSMNKLWDQAMARGTLHGLVHDGHWLHVGTPDAIGAAENYLRRNG